MQVAAIAGLRVLARCHRKGGGGTPWKPHGRNADAPWIDPYDPGLRAAILTTANSTGVGLSAPSIP